MARVTIGELKSVVKFERNELSNTAGGPGTRDNFSEFLQTRGRLTKRNGFRALDYGEVVEDNSYELVVRNQPTLYNELANEATDSLRVIMDDNRKFTVATWEKLDEKPEFIRLIVNEKR